MRFFHQLVASFCNKLRTICCETVISNIILRNVLIINFQYNPETSSCQTTIFDIGVVNEYQWGPCFGIRTSHNYYRKQITISWWSRLASSRRGENYLLIGAYKNSTNSIWQNLGPESSWLIWVFAFFLQPHDQPKRRKTSDVRDCLLGCFTNRMTSKIFERSVRSQIKPTHFDREVWPATEGWRWHSNKKSPTTGTHNLHLSMFLELKKPTFFNMSLGSETSPIHRHSGDCLRS